VRDAAEEVEWDSEHDCERFRLLQRRCLGTSSPSTTEKYVRMAKAMRKLTVADRGGSIRSEISGSPMAPMRIAKIVIPSCVEEMKRTGSSINRNAARAPRLPFPARSSSRARRAVIRAYSAATKTALPNTRRNTTRMRRRTLTPRQGRRYSAGFRRPR
jgi:hypothetical protein